MQSSACERERRRNKMRIVFFHLDLGIGGAEKLVVNAALALKKRNYDVVIYTSHHDPDRCFDATKPQGPLGNLIRVHGNWLPRQIFGRFTVVCASLRMFYLSFVAVLSFLHATLLHCVTNMSLSLLGSSQSKYVYDCIFLDGVSAPIPLLKLLSCPVLFYCHFPDKLLCKHRQALSTDQTNAYGRIAATAAATAPLPQQQQAGFHSLSQYTLLPPQKFRAISELRLPRSVRSDLLGSIGEGPEEIGQYTNTTVSTTSASTTTASTTTASTTTASTSTDLRPGGSSTSTRTSNGTAAMAVAGVRSFVRSAYRLPFDWLEEWTTTRADLVAVNSRYTAEIFRRAFPRFGQKIPLTILYPSLDDDGDDDDEDADENGGDYRIKEKGNISGCGDGDDQKQGDPNDSGAITGGGEKMSASTCPPSTLPASVSGLGSLFTFVPPGARQGRLLSTTSNNNDTKNSKISTTNSRTRRGGYHSHSHSHTDTNIDIAPQTTDETVGNDTSAAAAASAGACACFWSSTFASLNRYERKKEVELALLALARLKQIRSSRSGSSSSGSTAGRSGGTGGVGGGRSSSGGSSSNSDVRLIVAGGYDVRVDENREYFEELVNLCRALGLRYRTDQGQPNPRDKNANTNTNNDNNTDTSHATNTSSGTSTSASTSIGENDTDNKDVGICGNAAGAEAGGTEGEGEAEEEEEEEEAEGGGYNWDVLFLRSVPDACRRQLFEQAQGVLYTPQGEHFGIVPLEAMRAGTPVIAVNSGGPLETVIDGHTGFLVEPCPSQFARAMDKLLPPPPPLLLQEQQQPSIGDSAAPTNATAESADTSVSRRPSLTQATAAWLRGGSTRSTSNTTSTASTTTNRNRNNPTCTTTTSTASNTNSSSSSSSNNTNTDGISGTSVTSRPRLSVREEMGANARRHVTTSFGPVTFADKLEDAVNRVVVERGGCRAMAGGGSGKGKGKGKGKGSRGIGGKGPEGGNKSSSSGGSSISGGSSVVAAGIGIGLVSCLVAAVVVWWGW